MILVILNNITNIFKEEKNAKLVKRSKIIFQKPKDF